VGDTVYTATYDVADGNVEQADVDVSVSGAKDVAGNTQSPNPTTTADLFDIDTIAPTGTVTVDTDPIYEGDLVQGVTVTYDEAMDPLSTPTIGFAGATGTITSNGDGAWSVGNTVWTETFNVADADEETAVVTVTSSGATDVAGNAEGTSVSDTFAIDTTAPVPIGAALNATKTYDLIDDADGDGVVSPGDTLLYTVTIVNVGDAAATGVVFTDTPDANTTLVAGSVQTSHGTVTGGNAGVPPVTVDIGSIIPGGGGSVTITFRVTINNPLPAGVTQVANQGVVSSSNGLGDVLTDDLSTPQMGDPTVTEVHRHQPIAVPSVSVWGIVVMAALFAGSLVWLLRRRATADTSKQRG
jgi:uncharacterized repeat protein (TIGR01451 family)